MYYSSEQKKTAENPMSGAAFTFGILALITAVMGTVIFPFIFGGLAVVFASLARGGENKYRGKALRGFILGIAALLLNTGIFIYQWRAFLGRYNNDAQYRAEMNEMFDQMRDATGVDPRDYLDYLGYSFSSSFSSSPDEGSTEQPETDDSTDTPDADHPSDGKYTL